MSSGPDLVDELSPLLRKLEPLFRESWTWTDLWQIVSNFVLELVYAWACGWMLQLSMVGDSKLVGAGGPHAPAAAEFHAGFSDG